MFPCKPVGAGGPIEHSVSGCGQARCKLLWEDTYGRRPIAFTFHIPITIVNICNPMYANLTVNNRLCVASPSNLEKVFPTFERALRGFMNSIAVIIMEKIWSVFPDMYIMIMFMGNDFAGARATSQAFLIFKSSVSAWVGGVICFCDFCNRSDVDVSDESSWSIGTAVLPLTSHWWNSREGPRRSKGPSVGCWERP